MSDPKYPIIENKIYHIDGYELPHDEPIMVLRGKDIGALSAICDYLKMLTEQERNKVIISHYNSSLERLRAFYEYQIKNPELQSIGCTRRCHIDYTQILFMAKSWIDKGEML